ncbi:MAG: DUF2339 domain-containing protein [Berryella intestinalis]|nr:DUF2339 domain-containing protein [Berryella intestinalis]
MVENLVLLPMLVVVLAVFITYLVVSVARLRQELRDLRSQVLSLSAHLNAADVRVPSAPDTASSGKAPAMPASAPVPPHVAATSRPPAPPVVSPQGQALVPPSAALPSNRGSFESVLGRNVLGIVASVLVFFGVVFLGALVVPYLDDGLRCVFMYLISFAFLAAGLALSLRRRSQFSLAVLGTGAGALFISVLMTHLHFGFLGELETFALLLVWTAACMALVKRFDSLLLSIVAHVGMIVSVCFAYGAGFDDTRAAAVIVYQLLASALVVGGSALCFRRTYRFGLFASLGLTVVASLFIWERFGATLSVGFSSSLPDAAIVAAFSLQFAAASVLSVFLSVSASRLESSVSRFAVHTARVGLVFFELSVSWFAGREFPYLSDAVSSFVLVASVLAFYLAGFQRLSQEGSGWWVAAWVNELVALLAAALFDRAVPFFGCGPSSARTRVRPCGSSSCYLMSSPASSPT